MTMTSYNNMEIKYEESLYYQINSCARYFQLTFEQLIKQLDTEISAIEYLALSIIIDTKDCCQRDLARIILKDRASTGKIASSLKEKGCIKVELKTKNNRPVKILTPTKKGLEINQNIFMTINPIIKKIENAVSKETIKNTIETLKCFKGVVEQTMKSNI